MVTSQCCFEASGGFIDFHTRLQYMNCVYDETLGECLNQPYWDAERNSDLFDGTVWEYDQHLQEIDQLPLDMSDVEDFTDPFNDWYEDLDYLPDEEGEDEEYEFDEDEDEDEKDDREEPDFMSDWFY